MQHVYAVSAFCFCFLAADLAHGKNSQLDDFSLLKPFLTFKSHITTVLIAQNVAEASKLIDQFIFLLKSHSFIHIIVQKIFYLLRRKQSGAHKLVRLGSTKKTAPQ